jgi:hypothetical protein
VLNQPQRSGPNGEYMHNRAKGAELMQLSDGKQTSRPSMGQLQLDSNAEISLASLKKRSL